MKKGVLLILVSILACALAGELKEKELNDANVLGPAKFATDRIFSQRKKDGLVDVCITNFEMIRVMRGEKLQVDDELSNEIKKYDLIMKIEPIRKGCPETLVSEPEICKVTVIVGSDNSEDLEKYNCYSVVS